MAEMLIAIESGGSASSLSACTFRADDDIGLYARLDSLFASGGAMTGRREPSSESGTENEPEETSGPGSYPA